MRNYTLHLALAVLLSMPAMGPQTWDNTVAAAEEETHGDEEETHRQDQNAHEESLLLDDATRAEFGIEVAVASAGALEVEVHLPGEVQVNPDLLAHIVPRVPGVAQQIYAHIGDQVQAGQVLAVLKSRELSELKSSYLVARERLSLAQATFVREETLWRQAISSERAYLAAKNALAETRIDMRVAQQKLQALGFAVGYLEQLSFAGNEDFTRYEMVAPFAGTIIQKHIAQGEVLNGDSEAFVVADLQSVWIQLTAYQKDLPRLQVGQRVHIEAGQGGPSTGGPIAFISPIIDEATRTAAVRVVLPNDGQWRPGSFVAAAVDVERVEVSLLVPKSAIQSLENRPVIFVETDDGFTPQPVQVGRSNRTHSEIVAGLEAGQPYVARGAFTLKAQWSKGAFDDGHAH